MFAEICMTYITHYLLLAFSKLYTTMQSIFTKTGIFTIVLVCISSIINAQVTDTLAFQDFEISPRTPIWTYSGSPTFNSGYTGTSASPASSPKGIGGTRAWETTAVSGGVTLDFANRTIPTGYDSIRITFRLAAMNLNGTSGGPDNLDYVELHYTLNGGTNYTLRLKIRGSSANNSTWAYSATGVAKVYYLPATEAGFQPTTSGLQTSMGYSTCQIVFPGSITQLGARIKARSSSSSDTWLIDNMMLTGDKNCQPNTGSTSIVACNGYTSPSGRHHWTTSGSYLDTLQNAAGCDSILTVNLTINSARSSISPIACINYTSPSGKYVWTQSGSYTDTIARSAGCDSIINIILTIRNIFFQTIRVHACDIYTSPAGHTYTSAAVFIDTLTSTNGCDSLIQVILTMGRSATHQIAANACGSYVSPGGKAYTTSGVYTDSLMRNGCDSILTIQLNIAQHSNSAFAVKSCIQYTAPSGKIIAAPGIITDTIANAAGCDSIMQITVQLGSPNDIQITDTACNRFVSVTGKVITTGGIVSDTLINSYGCDSIINTKVHIENVDEGITVSGNKLQSMDVTGAYFWIDCENMSEIPGATARDYLATGNGRYAVKIVRDGCELTTPCVEVRGMSVDEYLLEKLHIYPNPAGDYVNIQFDSNLPLEVDGLYTIDGRKLNVHTTNVDATLRLEMPEAQGVYILHISAVGSPLKVRLLRR